MKPPLIIIGMHRSGTTFLSKVLMEAGIYMGEIKDRNNESFIYKDFNDNLLKANGGAWDDPVEVYIHTLQPKFRGKLRYYGTFRKPLKLLRNYLLTDHWGWKDPRNTFTLPYWLSLYPDAKVIHIYRNGIDVANSLYARNESLHKDNPDKSSILKNRIDCFNLWEVYINQAFRNKNVSKNFINIQYEALVSKDLETRLLLEDFLQISISEELGRMAKSSKNKINQDDELIEVAKESQFMQSLGYL